MYRSRRYCSCMYVVVECTPNAGWEHVHLCLSLSLSLTISGSHSSSSSIADRNKGKNAEPGGQFRSSAFERACSGVRSSVCMYVQYSGVTLRYPALHSPEYPTPYLYTTPYTTLRYPLTRLAHKLWWEAHGRPDGTCSRTLAPYRKALFRAPIVR